VSAQGIEFEHDKSFEEVLKMAKTQNKLIFMDCFTTWCGPCKRLSSMVFPDPAVGEYYNKNFINTKLELYNKLSEDKVNLMLLALFHLAHLQSICSVMVSYDFILLLMPTTPMQLPASNPSPYMHS
jgi:thiol-disulfide isomerase/thioredoxin